MEHSGARSESQPFAATGGQFKLTVPFSVSQGSAASVTKVTVTLTNSKGTSNPVSNQ